MFCTFLSILKHALDVMLLPYYVPGLFTCFYHNYIVCELKFMGFMRILMVVFERFPSRGWSVSNFNSRPAKLVKKKYTLTDTTLIKQSSLSQDLRASKKWTKAENPEKTQGK